MAKKIRREQIEGNLSGSYIPDFIPDATIAERNDSYSYDEGIWRSEVNDNATTPSLMNASWTLLATIGGVAVTKTSQLENDGEDGENKFVTEVDVRELSNFKGLFPNFNELESSYPVGESGWYADVDAGVDEDVIRHIWDVSDERWVPQKSATTLTSSQVKELYELNPNTNVFSDDEKNKLNNLNPNSEPNKIDKIFVNGVEQVPNLSKEVNISIEQNQAMVIKSQPVIVTNISGNNYAITAHANPVDNIIWQNPSGTVHQIDEDFVQIYTINTANFNVVHCVWLGYDGSIGVKFGTQVATGIAPSYPTPPADALGYSFVTFINGVQSTLSGLTPEQVQEMIDALNRSTHLEINGDYELTDGNSGKDVYLFGTSRVVTIPTFSTLIQGYNQTVCFIGAGGTIVNPNSAPIQGLPAGIDFPINIPQDGVVRFVRLNNLGSPTLRLEGDLM